MPATLDEAFNDPYAINKKRYINTLSQSNGDRGYGGGGSGGGSIGGGGGSGSGSGGSVPSNTSTFIKNPNYSGKNNGGINTPPALPLSSTHQISSQLNFGLTSSNNDLSKSAISNEYFDNEYKTKNSINGDIRRTREHKRRNKNKKHRSSKNKRGSFEIKRSPQGGGGIGDNVYKYKLLIINIIFGLIIISSMLLK
jgi:hypothetical protein